MGEVVPFPIDNRKKLNSETEALRDDTAALARDSARALRAAEELFGDVVTIDFSPSEPDYDSPA